MLLQAAYKKPQFQLINKAKFTKRRRKVRDWLNLISKDISALLGLRKFKYNQGSIQSWKKLVHHKCTKHSFEGHKTPMLQLLCSNHFVRKAFGNLILNLNPANNYMFKVNNRNTRRHWRRSGIFIVNFEHISHLALLFLLLTLSR